MSECCSPNRDVNLLNTLVLLPKCTKFGVLQSFYRWKSYVCRTLNKIYKGTHLEIPGVTVYRGRLVVITTVETALLDIDGEQPGQAPLTFSIHPQALCLWG